MCAYRMQQLKQKAEALSAILVYETPDYPSYNISCNGSSPTPAITKMDPYFKYKVIISYPKVLKLICLILLILLIGLLVNIKYLFQVPDKFDVVEKIKSNDEENSVNKIEMITDENVSF